MMKKTALLGLLVGLLIVVGLLQTQSVDEVADAALPAQKPSIKEEAGSVEVLEPRTVMEESAVDESAKLEVEVGSKREVVEAGVFPLLPAQDDGTVLVQVIDLKGSAINLASVFAMSASVENTESMLRWQAPRSSLKKKNHWGRTGSDGGFEFSELPSSHYRFAAWKDGMGFFATEAVAFAPDMDGQTVQIALQPVPAAHIVSGIVVDDTGEESRRPRVKWHTTVDGKLKTSDAKVSSTTGGWDFRVITDTPNQLGNINASSTRFKPQADSQRYNDLCYAFADDVRAGTTNLKLALRKSRYVMLDVRTQANEEVDAWGAVTELEHGGVWIGATATNVYGLIFAARDTHNRIRVPWERFRILIYSPAFKTEVLGPFRESEVKAVIQARLGSKPVVEGVAFSGGAPLSHATVRLKAVNRAEAKQLELPEQHFTDERGQFSIPTDMEGLAVVELKSLRGLTGRSPEFELDGVNDFQGLVIEVGASGSIFGRLHPPEDASSAPWFILFRNTDDPFEWIGVPVSNADDFDSGPLSAGTWSITHTQDAELANRYDGLLFGADDETLDTFRNGPLRYALQRAWPKTATPIRVTLEPGDRVEQNIDSTTAPAFRLDGRLEVIDEMVTRQGEQETQFEDWDPNWQAASARLISEDNALIASFPLRSDGSFTLGSHSKVSCTLEVIWVCGSGSRLTVRDQIDLKKPEASWHLALELGTLRVDSIGMGFSTSSPMYFATSHPRGASIRSDFDWASSDQTLDRIARIPAGEGTLIWTAPGDEAPTEQSVRVAAGQELELLLP